MNDHLVVVVDVLSELDEGLLPGETRALAGELLLGRLLFGEFSVDVAANHQDAAANQSDDGEHEDAHDPEDHPDPGRCL